MKVSRGRQGKLKGNESEKVERLEDAVKDLAVTISELI